MQQWRMVWAVVVVMVVVLAFTNVVWKEGEGWQG
jgi:hypothetical protein